MLSFEIVAATLMSAVLAVSAISITGSESTISTSPATQLTGSVSPRYNEAIDSTPLASTVAPQAHQALKPSGGDMPEPSSSLSVAVYAAVLITIAAMAYLVVKNFRMRYDVVRADRYGLKIRRGRRDQEVQPLARDDEDEEILFDVRGNLR
ncbi:uncharacterized protein LOC100907870 [Galendromus occidentalis]|uniref:Uncharacterized protein LOC100907870 n=1 Tax=Galendromus occidentalis TaxID=34638 RepID=A0AAJ6VUG3_9ACAR|nr:uncharacterized protein LOC100907870 [Galendromus occidentalis]